MKRGARERSEAGQGGSGDAERGPSRWAAPAFLGGAALLALLFYREFVFHPERLLFGTDMVVEGFPLRRFAVDELRAGRGLPLWNPFVYGGMPYLATLPGPVFYPSSFLYLLLPLYRAIGWTFVLHTFLAAAFGWFAARAFRLSPPSAAVTGVAFALSGYLLSTLYGGHDGRMFAIALVPLVFGATERGLRTGAGAWFLAAGAGIGLQIFTPHTQVMYFSCLWLLAYAAYRLVWMAGEREGGWTALRGRALWVATAFGLAAAIGAIQLLPTYALLDHVGRAAAEEGYAFAASWALPPQEVTALVLPDLIGSLETYWGGNPFKLHTEYAGGLAVVLAAVAVAGSFAGDAMHRERRTVWFLTAAGAGSLLFALGSATPLHRVAYEAIPFMGSFRAPSMMLGPGAFFLALLAGFGWERVRRAKGGSFPWTLAGLLTLPLAALGLAATLAPGGLLDFAYHAWYPPGWSPRPPTELTGPLRLGGGLLLLSWLGVFAAAWGRDRGRIGEWVVLPLLLLLAADLWHVDARYLRTAPAEELFRTDPAIEAMGARSAPGERAWPLEGSYQANELMYHGIPTVSGTQKFMLTWYRDLVGGLGYEELLRRPALWSLFDLRWVTLRSEQETPLLRRVDTGSGGSPRLYEVTVEAAHAFFPERLEAASGLEEALRRTLALGSPTGAAVVETPGPEDAGGPIPAGLGRATVERRDPDEVVLSVDAEREGLLFVSEIWAPGWRAWVDDGRVPVRRVNGAFRGVVVPEGRHEVRFAYLPASVRWGGWVSAAGLLALLVGLAIPSVRRGEVA